ncbi:MAG: CHAT domain-containing protein [Winogradskyella sp.]|uniref:CHAT domain-containing protein n=1 Tax=Winogradskyella sp. TaxID=1883156 RepID=UPI000F3B262F|nr:CHAT domain-containing protein [Winogradskyella sp.]RNC86714.1 MAG: CHAT domain-containing protein [Winogradskyella sp.]
MRSVIVAISIIFCCHLNVLAQNNDVLFNTPEIDSLIKKHQKDIRALYDYRGAPQDWITTDNFDDRLLQKVLAKYTLKNVGILVYTYYENTLKISLFSKRFGKAQYNEHEVQIDASLLQNHVNNANYLFSSNFLNRAPKLRGAEGNSNTSDGEASYTILNEILLPNSLELSIFDHLIIVPTFNIATLPFGAFKIKDLFTDEALYLIDKMSYSIAPNLFELLLSSDKNEHRYDDNNFVNYQWDNALFVANPEYPNNLKWDFPDLPGAEQEVNYVLEKSKPKAYNRLSGKIATKENVLDSICKYDLLYFATHGISNSEQPMDHSFLVLADNNTETSYLSLREIMNTRHTCKLKADLVVLSACQTGLGKSHQGGIIGLARAFQIAGAQHVLMSLWNISDSETATMMKFFFNELETAKELMPHEALRRAILNYKNNVNDDPKYWAAFSIFGVPY